MSISIFLPSQQLMRHALMEEYYQQYLLASGFTSKKHAYRIPVLNSHDYSQQMQH
jgi:hypothetical protein